MQKINFQNLPSTISPINDVNLNLLQDNVEDAITDLFEVGSNENGNYIKYADGRLECWNEITKSLDITTAWGPLYASPFENHFPDFPVRFISRPIVNVSSQSVGGYRSFIVKEYPPSDTNVNSFAVVGSWSSSQNNMILAYHAIGRWK